MESIFSYLRENMCAYTCVYVTYVNVYQYICVCVCIYDRFYQSRYNLFV